MLSIETEARVAKILLALSEGEQNIEIHRQGLFEDNNFDPFKLFRRLDNESKNRIDAIDISAFLKSKGIYCTEIEAQFLILFYDEDGDGLLSYCEFLSMLQPIHNSKSTKHITSNHSDIPSYNEEYSLSKFLEKEIELGRSLTTMINELKTRSDFNIHSIYHAIKNIDCVTVESMKNFFERNNISCVNSDIKAIMKRLDFNKDGKIDICELHALLGFPLCTRCCPCVKNCNCVCCENCCCKFCDYNYSNNNGLLTKQCEINTTNINNNEYDVYNESTKYYKTTSPCSVNNIETNKTNTTKPISKHLSLRLSPDRKYSPRASSYYNNDTYLPTSTLYNNNNNTFTNIHTYQNQKIFQSPRHYPFTLTEPSTNTYSSTQKHKFINYLQTIMQFESKIEHAKIGLAIRDDFNIEDAFRIFEINGRGYLTEDDLKYGLNAFGIYPKPSELHLFVKRYDLKNESVLSFADFFDMVTPYEKPYRSMLERRPPKSCYSCHYPNVFLFTTRLMLKQLFIMLIDIENKFNYIKKDFTGVRSKLREIFNEIDVKNVGYFNEKELEVYLHKNNIFSSIKDTYLLFIHLDKNRDGKVDYFELEKEITPSY